MTADARLDSSRVIAVGQCFQRSAALYTKVFKTIAGPWVVESDITRYYCEVS
jgi:hypothetical protein